MQHVGIGHEEADPSLTNRAAHGAGRWDRIDELWHVAVVDAGVRKEAVHQHQPRELQGGFRLRYRRGRRLCAQGKGDGGERDEQRGPHLGLLAVSVRLQ